jgi:hypothetical protein
MLCIPQACTTGLNRLRAAVRTNGRDFPKETRCEDIRLTNCHAFFFNARLYKPTFEEFPSLILFFPVDFESPCGDLRYVDRVEVTR